MGRGKFFRQPIRGVLIAALLFGVATGLDPALPRLGMLTRPGLLAAEVGGGTLLNELRRLVVPLLQDDDAPSILPGIVPQPARELPLIYREGRYGEGALEIVNHVPLLILRGSPEAIAEQEAALTVQAAAELVAAPQDLLEKLAYPGGWEGLVNRGRTLWRYIPEEYKRELTAMAKKAGLSRDELLAVNALPDMYRDFACSSLLVLPQRSATGKMLFGRNLDFFSPRQLYRYTIIKVYNQPGKKYRFASVGFPGFIGCLTGMNEAGLCLAVHEVHLTADGSPMFAPQGMPYAMLLRQIMERCATVDEAISLLRSARRTTLLNIALCDTKQAVVAEITPRQVEVRGAEAGLCACTNHFRTPSLRTVMLSWRYERLLQVAEQEKIDVATVQKKLDEANLGFLTIQSMVFEPGDLVIHLATGIPPVTKRAYHRVDLSSYLRGGERPASGGR